MAVYLFATLDTKGREAQFVHDRLVALGVAVKLVDVGCLGEPSANPDITREAVFGAAGTSLAEQLSQRDRGQAVTAAARGAAQIARQAFASGELTGVFGLGGSAGATIGTAAMRELPLGVPKLMVSTLASGNVRPFVGDKDILMLNSVVDIAGINRISRPILLNAAAAMSGMVQLRRQTALQTAPVNDKPLIAATMFGVTTPCVERARKRLEEAGYEVLVFHATGSGGQAMESLIREGAIVGVLDITTTELADELCGGVLSAGPTRLTAAGECGIPQVISVGALDMVNFGPRETVPQRYSNRLFYQHNASVTLMRTTPEECAQLGVEIGRKAASARGRTAIILPLQGVSAIDRAGQTFESVAARDSLFRAIEKHCGSVSVHKRDAHINDEAFALFSAETLLELLASES